MVGVYLSMLEGCWLDRGRLTYIVQEESASPTEQGSIDRRKGTTREGPLVLPQYALSVPT